MPSVVTSARTSTASVFDFVTVTADSAAKLVGTFALGIDMMDVKFRAVHDDVVLDTIASSEVSRERIIFNRATEFTDLLEETHRRNYPSKPFDRAKHYEAALARITKALESTD